MALLSRRYKPNLTLNFKELEDFERRLKVLHGMTVKHRRREMQKITTYALRPTKRQDGKLEKKYYHGWHATYWLRVTCR